MKKIIALILTLAAVFSLAACGSSSTPAAATEAPAAAEATEAPAAAEPVEITVGATAVPHAEILEQVKDALAEEGYTLNIVIYDDYVLPNQALAEGTLDANYFQHRPYLNSYNESNGTDLVSAASSTMSRSASTATAFPASPRFPKAQPSSSPLTTATAPAHFFSSSRKA